MSPSSSVDTGGAEQESGKGVEGEEAEGEQEGGAQEERGGGPK